MLGDKNLGPWIFGIWQVSLPGFDYRDNRVVISP